jgi:hypothetical protein
LEVAQEVEQVGQGVVRDRRDRERPGVADADHEAGGVGGGQELAGELDARGHGPAAGALLADPGDHGVAADVRAVAGEQVGAGEGAVERVGQLEVPVADRAAGREVHVRPSLQDGERGGVGVEAGAEVC